MSKIGKILKGSTSYDVYLSASSGGTPAAKCGIQTASGTQTVGFIKSKTQDAVNLFIIGTVGYMAKAKPVSGDTVVGTIAYGWNLPIIKVAEQPAPSPAPAPSGKPSLATTAVNITTTQGKLSLNGNTAVKTYSNIRFDARGSNYAVQADQNNALVTFINCEFINAQSALFYGRNLKFINCAFHFCQGDGGKPTSNVTLIGCYFTNLGLSDTAHADGLQIRGDTGGGDNITVTGCYFNQAKDNKRNTCVFVQVASCENITVNGNWFDGSNGPGAVDIWNSAKPGTIRVTNNVFDLSTLGPKTPAINVQSGVVVSGNMDQNGHAIAA